MFYEEAQESCFGLEPLFFDPDTVTLIPQSGLKKFILKEGQKTEDEASNGKVFTQLFSHSVNSTVDASVSSPILAEEEDLIMPPPSP